MKEKKHRDAIYEILHKNMNLQSAFTRWELYNALTQYATHGEQLSARVEERLQAKARQVMSQPLMVLAAMHTTEE